MLFNKALIQLAQRKNKSTITWWTCSNSIIITNGIIKCIICDGNICFSFGKEGLEIIRSHGIQHLKEHNLLAFL